MVAGHGQMDFYITQVMSSHGAFNKYLFHMRLAESNKCVNWDRRGRDDDAWHTPFECPAFQLYREDVMTTLQQWVNNFFHRTVWSQLYGTKWPFFFALTMGYKMELVQEQWRRPTATVTQHPISDLTIPPPCLLLATRNMDSRWQPIPPQLWIQMGKCSRTNK